MPIPNYFVALHLTVNGKNDETLGTDESELSTIEIVVIDSELKKVCSIVIYSSSTILVARNVFKVFSAIISLGIMKRYLF